jgi:hypothetical protein
MKKEKEVQSKNYERVSKKLNLDIVKINEQNPVFVGKMCEAFKEEIINHETGVLETIESFKFEQPDGQEVIIRGNGGLRQALKNCSYDSIYEITHEGKKNLPSSKDYPEGQTVNQYSVYEIKFN